MRQDRVKTRGEKRQRRSLQTDGGKNPERYCPYGFRWNRHPPLVYQIYEKEKKGMNDNLNERRAEFVYNAARLAAIAAQAPLVR